MYLFSSQLLLQPVSQLLVLVLVLPNHPRTPWL